MLLFYSSYSEADRKEKSMFEKTKIRRRILNSMDDALEAKDMPAYRTLSESLVELDRSSMFPSGDGILSAITSMLSVLVVLNYERLHVVSSKAMQFIQKPSIKGRK